MKVGDLVQLLTPNYHEPIDEMVGIVLGFTKQGRVHVGWGKPQLSPSAPGYVPAWPYSRLKVLNESR